MDRFFATISIAEHFLAKTKTVVETLRANRKRLPKERVDMKEIKSNENKNVATEYFYLHT